MDKRNISDLLFEQLRASAIFPAVLLAEMVLYGEGKGGVQMFERIRTAELIIGFDPVDLQKPPVVFAGHEALAKLIERQIKPLRFMSVLLISESDEQQIGNVIKICRRSHIKQMKPRADN